jgi:hypothetical protein
MAMCGQNASFWDNWEVIKSALYLELLDSDKIEDKT